MFVWFPIHSNFKYPLIDCREQSHNKNIGLMRSYELQNHSRNQLNHYKIKPTVLLDTLSSHIYTDAWDKIRFKAKLAHFSLRINSTEHRHFHQNLRWCLCYCVNGVAIFGPNEIWQLNGIFMFIRLTLVPLNYFIPLICKWFGHVKACIGSDYFFFIQQNWMAH